MADIRLHLTSFFYPPIPDAVQAAVQSFFDEIVRDGQPVTLVLGDDELLDQRLKDPSALDRSRTLPNGATVRAEDMMNELRLWEHLFADGQWIHLPDVTDLKTRRHDVVPEEKLSRQIIDGFADSRVNPAHVAWLVKAHATPHIDAVLREFFDFYITFADDSRAAED